MTKFEDIISLEDQYEVAKAKATIAFHITQWCYEVIHFRTLFRMVRNDVQG